MDSVHSVSMDKLTDDVLFITLSRLSPIELLKLRTVNQRMKQLTERCLKQLKVLTIEYKFYAGLAANDGKTHTINNTSITIKDELILASKLLKFCSNLREISLKIKETKEKSFSIFCDKLINTSDSLIKMSLAADRFCQKYNDINLVRLAIVAPKIQSMTIGDGINEKDIGQFLQSANQLNILQFKYSNEKISGECLMNAPISLNQLIISGSVYWWEVSNRFVNKVMEAIKARKLKLTSLTFECKGIKQDTLNLINDTRLITTLQSLEFRRPQLYSPEMRLIDLKPLTNMINLTSIHLAVFPFVDDTLVTKILIDLKKLKQLTIRIPVSNFHPLITDSSIDSISKFSPNLELINFQNIRISDNCIKRLVNLKHLKSLTLEDVNISRVDTIPEVIKKTPSLSALEINQCFNFSPNQLTTMILSVINGANERPTVSVTVEQETVFVPPKKPKLPKNVKLTYKYFNSNF